MSSQMQEVPAAYAGKALEDVLARVAEIAGGSSDAIISRALSAGRSSVSTWRARGTIPYEQVALFADEKGLCINWLLFGKGPRTLHEAAEAEMVRLVNTAGVVLATEQNRIAFEWQGQLVTINPDDYGWVPVFDIAFGAGNGKVIDFNEPPVAWDAYRKSYLRSASLLGHMLFKGTIKGDSMFPKLHDRSVQLFDASDKVIRSGEIFGVRIGDELICKYLRHVGGGLIEVSSENPAKEYSPFTIRAEQLGADIEIVGRVVL